jgi:hypothetical protein
MEGTPFNLPEQKFEREAGCMDFEQSPNFVIIFNMLWQHLLASHATSAFFVEVALIAYNKSPTSAKCNFEMASIAPIGVYHSRFFPEESMACRCGFLMETVSHVLYWCLSHEQESEPKEQLCYSWLLKFLEANESAFAFNVP